MTDVTLNKIYLQYAKKGRTGTTLMVQFANYKGRHDFILGDDSATWSIETTQPNCTGNTICKITTTTAEEAVLIKPLSELTWIANTASDLFTIDGDDYKITFTQP